MIRRAVSMLMALAFVISVFVIAARAAPTKKAFASKAAVETVSPIVATASAMIGYDVIQNITTERRDLSIAQNTLNVDTSTQRGLSPTRAVSSRSVLARCRSGTQ